MRQWQQLLQQQQQGGQVEAVLWEAVATWGL
jgi:hypothetical protein